MNSCSWGHCHSSCSWENTAFQGLSRKCFVQTRSIWGRSPLHRERGESKISPWEQGRTSQFYTTCAWSRNKLHDTALLSLQEDLLMSFVLLFFLSHTPAAPAYWSQRQHLLVTLRSGFRRWAKQDARLSPPSAPPEALRAASSSHHSLPWVLCQDHDSMPNMQHLAQCWLFCSRLTSLQFLCIAIQSLTVL